MISLSFAVDESLGDPCPVCKTPITESATIAYRIPYTYENWKAYGDILLQHYKNWGVVCSKACAQRFTASWSGEAKESMRKQLISDILADASKGEFSNLVKVRKA